MCDLLVSADMVRADQLHEEAIRFFRKHKAEVRGTESWKRLCTERPQLVMHNIDQFVFDDETCQRREVNGDSEDGQLRVEYVSDSDDDE